MIVNLKDWGFDFHTLSLIRIGDGAYTSFWHDTWKGDKPFVVSFHRGFALDNHCISNVKDCF